MNPGERRLPRRGFLRQSALLAGVLGTGPALMRAGAATPRAASQGTAADLPRGSAPAALDLPHFPSRLHAFVWRNWSLVPLDRLAAVVGARPRDLRRIGRSLGLTAPPRLTADRRRRSHLTVIRRNWHLLPYEQLLALLDWTADQLAFALKEDDFLFVKLGRLKPEVPALRWAEPDAAAAARAAEIARLVRAEFPEGAEGEAEPLFTFVGDLADPPAGRERPLATGLSPRFCYSYFALYGDPLLDAAADPYPDGYLARLAQAGVDGVWLPAVLYQLAPFPWQPGLSEHHAERRANLRRLVTRAARHGIRVFLYLNEPRSLPRSFFATHPELEGGIEGDQAALCTSTEPVQRYLTDAIALLARSVPGLGGCFTITGSENFTHCWSHGRGQDCPRCGPRGAADVIAELIHCLQAGLQAAAPDARPQLIAWDWGWQDAWVPDIIARLPAEAALMSVSEWSLPITRGGVDATVGEYSLSAVGPGPRATRHWHLARERGLRTLAKIQAGNTWELSAVPYIPAVANAAQHVANLRGAGVDGLMLGWTLGGYPSPNLEVAAEIATAPTVGEGTVTEALRRVAARRFGAGLAAAAVRAWETCSRAFREFPYHIGVVYHAPLQLGPANLLWPTPTGYPASMVGLPYDDLNAWRAVYPPAVFAAQLERVAEGFEAAHRDLAEAAGTRDIRPREARALTRELGVMEAAAIHFRSVAHQARFVLARDALAAEPGPEMAGKLRPEMATLLAAEAALARRLHALQSADSRLGFEASNQYYYVPLDLVEKVINCHWLRDQGQPGRKAGDA